MTITFLEVVVFSLESIGAILTLLFLLNIKNEAHFSAVAVRSLLNGNPCWEMSMCLQQVKMLILCSVLMLICLDCSDRSQMNDQSVSPVLSSQLAELLNKQKGSGPLSMEILSD